MSQPNLTSVGATQLVKMGGFIPENYTFATFFGEVILFSGWLLDLDTVWDLFVFMTLFSFNVTVSVTHCKRFEHLHGVRLERCF